VDGGESYKEVTEGDLTQVPLHTLTTHTLLYFMDRETERERQRERERERERERDIERYFIY
jgi:2-phosphoglycerate kinase